MKTLNELITEFSSKSLDELKSMRSSLVQSLANMLKLENANDTVNKIQALDFCIKNYGKAK